MLGKVIKFDLKATARFFLPMYAGLIILTLINKLSMVVYDANNQLMRGLSMTVLTFYALGLFAVFVMTQIFIVWHFYKNLTGDEGYLMFTLPVKPSTHVNAKVLTSVIWTLCTFILICASFMILASGNGLTDFFRSMGEFWDELKRLEYSSSIITLLSQTAILMLLNLFNGPLMYFCCIALGHLFGKHRVAGAVVSYIGIHVVLQIVSTIFMVILGSGMNVPYNSAAAMTTLFSFSNTFMIFSIVFTLLTTVLFYLISTYIFTWKLNLE